jgi:transcriptional regulator with XRE-family HTH domain
MQRAPLPDQEWIVFVAKLGQNLQRTRADRGLSQEHVAYTAGLSRYTYQKYEKGESRPGAPANPSLKVLLTIAQTLGVSLEDLLPSDVPDLTAR